MDHGEQRREMDMSQTSQALVAAIAQIWPELPTLVGGDWGEFQSVVLTGLAALEDAELAVSAAAGDAGKKIAAYAAVEHVRNDILGLFSSHPAAGRRFNQQFDEMLKMLDERRGSARPPAGSRLHNAELPFFEIPVFYATDRKWAGPPEWYTGERASSADLSYGVIAISLPVDRKIGTIPTRMAGSFRVAFRRANWSEFNPQKYCEIMSVNEEPVSGFAEEAGAVARAGRGGTDSAGPTEAPGPDAAGAHDILVFIHGFNVSFEAAARRAAQLAYDLDFTGVIVLYSWPSRGAVTGYTADTNSADWSTPHFVNFVREMLPGIGARQIHVLAHSMGNQILARALDRLGPSGGQRLGHVVFVAPDVDDGVFGQLAGGFGDRAVSYTLYMSSKDLALRVSGIVGGHSRAGYDGRNPDSMARIEIIDASRLPKTDVLGHSGFAEDRTMLNDLKDIIRYGRTADERSAVEPRNDPDGHRYWAFPA
jgi:esterase/lipase superfamily enzyme